MTSGHYFYEGSNYGFEPKYSDAFLGISYKSPAEQFGITTDPRNANQLKEVSGKLSTGAKTIEVSGVSPEIMESIPNQHLDEINRLRKLAGVELTFHGPLVEPSGVTRQGWDNTHREQAERQIWDAVKRSHKINPDGNVVVTLHSSQGVPRAETKIFNEKTGKEELREFFVADESSGQFANIVPQINYLLEAHPEENPEKIIKKEIEKRNRDSWFRELQQVNFHAHAGSSDIDRAFNITEERKKALPSEQLEIFEKQKPLAQLYKAHLEGKGAEKMKEIESEFGPEIASAMNQTMKQITHGDIYLRDAYQELQSLFNKAYNSAYKSNNKEDIEKLEAYRHEMLKRKEDFKDVEKIEEFADAITKGVSVLRSVQTPQTLKPMKEFLVDKSGETFANVALKSYKEFAKGKSKNTAPIISVENPPFGAGLSTGEELNELIDSARKKFVEKAVLPESRGGFGLSEKQADKEAEKLIGATWDVGHINMMRKYGYDEEELLKQTKKIAPKVKHIHLSDNFGLEHTELPMGMGNVPIKKEMEILNKFNKQARKIIETGGAWYRDFKVSPLNMTLGAFGSPLYSSGASPSWTQSSGLTGEYSSGYGNINPDVHHATYGAGFSNLPAELGGQMAGRSRLSGTPME
jgi:hypothetical protein